MLSLYLISMLSFQANGECMFQEDPENVVSTQLEGSWVFNEEISLVLTPWSNGFDLKEMK